MDSLKNNYSCGACKGLSICFPLTAKSKWTDVALLTGITAFSVFGILASMQAFTFIDATMTLKLSYGMYGSAFALLILQVARTAIIYCGKEEKSHNQNTTFDLSGGKLTFRPSPFVRPVPKDYVKPAQALSRPHVKDELDAMRCQVDGASEKFADQFFPNEKEIARADFKDYLLKIIEDKDFQQDSQAYLKAWKAVRGNTEQFFPKEDTAFAFFQGFTGKV